VDSFAKPRQFLSRQKPLALSLLIGADAPRGVRPFLNVAGEVSRLVDRADEFENAVRRGRAGLADLRMKSLDLIPRDRVQLARSDSRTNVLLQNGAIIADRAGAQGSLLRVLLRDLGHRVQVFRRERPEG